MTGRDITLQPPGVQHARDLLRLALEHEAQAGTVYEELRAAVATAAPNARQGVSQFAAATHEFASVVLRSQQHFPAHVVDFATGVLSEALAFVQADRNARWD